MADDAQQIRTLVEEWAAAVHAGDMDGRWTVAREHHSFAHTG